MSNFSTSKELLLVTTLIVITQTVLALYGAGLRRPFGSVKTVYFLPKKLREANKLVLTADLVFTAFIITMWITIFHVSSTIWYPVVSGLVLFSVGNLISDRVGIVRSFWASLPLAAIGLILAATIVLVQN